LSTSEPVASVRAQIDPMFLNVIEVTNEHGNFLPMAFFTELLIQLRQIDREVDLLHLFVQLSTTAFQGFSFSESEAAVIDELLAQCETISMTLSAPDDDPRH